MRPRLSENNSGIKSENRVPTSINMTGIQVIEREHWRSS